MNTKDDIKQKSLELFNQKGFSEVTLRDIASALGKSYGNITYHFPTKENLLNTLYFDMVDELQSVSIAFKTDESLFTKILSAPKYTFDISFKYLFLFKDYNHILRTYPNIAAVVMKSNEARKQAMLQTLVALQMQEILRKDLQEKDLQYIMELSSAMRTYFFLQINDTEANNPELQATYVSYVNLLLYPYLTEKGQKLWNDYMLLDKG